VFGFTRLLSSPQSELHVFIALSCCRWYYFVCDSDERLLCSGLVYSINLQQCSIEQGHR